MNIQFDSEGYDQVDEYNIHLCMRHFDRRQSHWIVDDTITVT